MVHAEEDGRVIYFYKEYIKLDKRFTTINRKIVITVKVKEKIIKGKRNLIINYIRNLPIIIKRKLSEAHQSRSNWSKN